MNRRKSNRQRRLAFPRAVAVCALLCCAPVPGRPQDSVRTVPERGVRPTGTYDISEIETIDVVSRNVHLNIPLASLPPGRAGMTAGISLAYNSSLYEATQVHIPEGGGRPAHTEYWLTTSGSGGWRYSHEFGMEEETSYRGPVVACGNQEATLFRIWFVAPDGDKKLLRLVGQPDDADGFSPYEPNGKSACPSVLSDLSGTLSYITTDGSFIRVDLTADPNVSWTSLLWTAFLPDGSKVSGYSNYTRSYDTGSAPDGYLHDRNGNRVLRDNLLVGGQPAVRLQDDLGRFIEIKYLTAESKDEITQQGPDGELKTTVYWGGVTTPVTWQKNQFEDAVTMNINHLVVTRIDLPPASGTSPVRFYRFYYTSADPGYSGELTRIDLPTGAGQDHDYEASYDYEAPSMRYLGRLVDNPVTAKTITYTAPYDGQPVTESETTTYEPTLQATGTVITYPDGGTAEHYFVSPDAAADPLRGLVYKIVEPHATTERQWWRNRPFGVDPNPGNPYIRTEVRTVVGTTPLAAGKVFTHDRNGNLTQTAEYHWGAPGQIPRDGLGRITGVPAGAVAARTTVQTFYNATTAAGDGLEPANEMNGYWNIASPPFKRAVQRTEVRAGGAQGTVAAATEFAYDNASTTGNLTAGRRWDSTRGGYAPGLNDSNSILTRHEYSIHGNRTKTTDPNGVDTTTVYDSNDLYPVHIHEASNRSSEQRSWTLSHQFQTGLLLSRTDDNNGVTSGFDYEPLGRPEKVTEAGMRETNTVYDDENLAVLVKADLDTMADGKLTTVRHFDPLWRVRLERTTDGVPLTLVKENESAGIKVQRRYRTVTGARYELVSNPYRAATSGAASSEQTMGWTRTKRDTAGRVVEVRTFDGAGLPAPWGTNANSTGAVTTEYNANEVTVTDQAGKVKKTYSDALGRLTSVAEDPAALNYTTSYVYDVLDNLTSVTQGGQTRTFVYTSLSRLKDATNPESGHTGYTYDANGNLLTKTDARGIVTTFDPYDGLNRPTRKSYSDGTPEITYLYDGPCLNCWGRLWMVYAVADDFYSDHDYHYDELGRVILSGQYTWTPSGEGQQYWFRYGYKKSGAVETITYPTGRVVTNSYDGAGRLSGVSGYASGIQYAPHGPLAAMTLGNGVAESRTYNGRLQPGTITAVKDSNTLLSLTYGYGGTNNNGNVVSQTIAPLGVTQLYSTYDGLNRLKTFAEGGLSRTYDHDRYGNRWVASNNGLPLAPQTPIAQSWFEAASNRIVAVDYDEAGNQEQVNPYRMEYDAENRQKSSTLTIGAETYTSRYYYDPEHGRRVAKVTPDGAATVYVYDAFGKLAAEYGNPGPLEPATSYLTADHLGSTRLVTGSTGPVKERHDYLPFGEELFAGTGPRTQEMGYPISEPLGGVRQKFTGKERDAETQGLDYFGARYFSAAQGRFTTPDQVLIDQDPSDPQSWNLYSYVRNNPLRFIDPTGRACVWNNGKWEDDNSGGQSCSDVDKENKNLKPSATVTVPFDELKLMMLQSVGRNMSSPRQWAEATRHGMEGAMAVEGIRALPSAYRGLKDLFELWRAIRLVPASLEALASAGGPTIEVVTSQTQALNATRGLSTAVGESAAAFAKSFQPGGTLYTAKIPEALVRALKSRGWAQTFTHANGTELYFKPEAMQYVLRFFQQ